MKLAIHCSNLSWPGGPAALAPTLAEVARTADQGGLATLTMMDHWFQMEQLGGPPEPMLEGYTSLGFIAGQTSNLELGLLVTGVTYRHPGLLAKIATTLDVLSGGRAMLGIGAAWYEREHRGLGVPFPPVAERFERLEETLQIARLMFSGEGGSFAGSHYRLEEAVNVPAPLRPGGPRVLVGGSGERKTLRLVAQYADACNFFEFEPEEMRHKIEVLDRHCEEADRDPLTVQRTALIGRDPHTDADGFLRRVEEYAALGIEQVWVMPSPDDPVGWVAKLCAEVRPRLEEIG
jgi:F420-dependent oxidoreductase-like protein